MNNRFHYLAIGFASLVLVFATAGAQAMGPPRPGDVYPGDPWHVAPNDFTFGNHIDTHIQLRQEKEEDEPVSLRGSFYIIFTEDDGVTPLGTDPVSGLPLARHPRGLSDSHSERCGIDPIICYVGWYLDGVPGKAKYLYHSGINGNDHPVWMVNRAEGSALLPPMDVSAIPQPGYYSHYHWITNTSEDPRAGTVLAECNKANAGQLQDQGPTAVNEICQGWFLQLQAVREFAFMHGGEVIPVHLGEDLRTHLNMVTNYDQTPVVPITETRSSGGGH